MESTNKLFFFFLILTLIGCGTKTTEEEAAIQNVVVIIGDDHAATVVGCYGNDIIRTPNLDRMAAEGVRFTNAFANAPLCSASRQSILTGKYPHAAGVTLLRTSFPEEQVTIADHLKKFGYQTAVVGKTHFNNDGHHGFDRHITKKAWYEYLKKNATYRDSIPVATRPPWKPFRDPARIWLNADKLPSSLHDRDMEGRFYANKASEFIQENKDRPFCLWVGFHEPHSPFHFPLEDTSKYVPSQMPIPEGSPEDDRWIPAIFKDLTKEEKQGIIASYYTSVEHMDKNVGLILNKIKELGLDKNTLVIYIGDQGYLLGDHKRFEKHMMWDEAVRSPLILQAGRQYGINQTFEQICEFVDLIPTMLDVLELPYLDTLHGKSLHPLLSKKTSEHKPLVFSEFLADNKAMIRTEKWKYIFTSGKRDLGQGYATGNPPSGILHRLYDLEMDPKESKNVAAFPENQKVLAILQQQLLQLFANTHPKSDSLPTGLSLDDKLSWYCEPPDLNADLEAK